MSTSVLFVCMGNICRSPAAEAIFKARVAEAGLQNRIRCDSAGTLGYHSGELPDPRMRKAGHARGYSLDSRARQVTAADLHAFDEVIAMDMDNLAYLQSLQEKTGGTASLSLMCDYGDLGPLREVPDPYYGGAKGFEHVLDLLETACSGLLDAIRQRG